MAESKIEWTDFTWNPWHGCKKVSDGCKNCYMFRDKKRFGQDPTQVIRASDKTFPVFVKQIELNGKVEKDIDKFPPHLQIREFPNG